MSFTIMVFFEITFKYVLDVSPSYKCSIWDNDNSWFKGYLVQIKFNYPHTFEHTTTKKRRARVPKTRHSGVFRTYLIHLENMGILKNNFKRITAIGTSTG